MSAQPDTRIGSPARQSWAPVGALIALVVGAAALFAIAGRNDRSPAGQPARRYNVLLISLDTTRRDHLSCYGYPRRTTPKLDAVAQDGLLFTRCVASSNWTVPTHASMLTGLYPTSHGAHWVTTDVPHINRENPVAPMSDTCETLAGVLARNGYRTGAIVANSYLSRVFGLDQGFEHYDDRPGEPPALYRQAGEITDEATRWLAGDRQRPFLLFLNYLDPHAPYNPPPPFNTMFRNSASPHEVRSWGMRFWSDVRNAVLNNQQPLSPSIQKLLHARYDGEIAHVDHEVGRLLDWLKRADLYDKTLVVVTGDHGESFGEHALMGHGVSLYEPELAVPLIVKLPFSRRAERMHHLVSHADIMPTALQVLGLPRPAAIQGRSMLRPATRDVVSEQYVCAANARTWPHLGRSLRAVYRGSLKYIEYSDGAQELYDLHEDPQELKNLAESRPQDVQQLQAALRNWSRRTPPPAAASAAAPEIPDEVKEQLRDLGYLQ